MFAMGMTRQRQSDRDNKLKISAHRRALQRKHQRELAREEAQLEEEESGEEPATDEEVIGDTPEFFDICTDKAKESKDKKKVKKKGKGKEPEVEKKLQDPQV